VGRFKEDGSNPEKPDPVGVEISVLPERRK